MLCAQHNPTAAALSTSFFLNHALQTYRHDMTYSVLKVPLNPNQPTNHPEPCPEQPDLNALITGFSKSYSSMSMSRESKRLKKSSSDWLNSGDTLIQHLSEKMQFLFPLFAR